MLGFSASSGTIQYMCSDSNICTYADPEALIRVSAGTSRGEAGDKNFWEAPTEPQQWTANQVDSGCFHSCHPRLRAETGISVTAAAAAVSLDSIACDYYVGRRAATSRCLTMRCKHRQTPAVIYLQRGFAVLGIAGVGCYALLRGWLRAKQADLPEMKKVPHSCAAAAYIIQYCVDGDSLQVECSVSQAPPGDRFPKLL